MASKIVVEMVCSGLRIIRGVFIIILRLVPHVLSYLVISTFKATVDLNHKVPNLRIVGLSHLHNILLVHSVDNCTLGFLMKRKINTSDTANLAIVKGTFLQAMLQLGLIRSPLLLF